MMDEVSRDVQQLRLELAVLRHTTRLAAISSKMDLDARYLDQVLDRVRDQLDSRD
jgi:hypothetical protein